jgi:bifunctional DNase/RNase
LAKGAKEERSGKQDSRKILRLLFLHSCFPESLASLPDFVASFHFVLSQAQEFPFFARMSKQVVQVQVRAILPYNNGRAVFVGNEQKVFVIYVDESVGAAIAMFMNKTPKERPLTHDLMAHLLAALGGKVDRVIVNDLKSETYFARLIISAENELHAKKIVEIDGRPSDCIAMAIQQGAPIYVAQDVWDEVEDRTDILRKMEEQSE